MISMKFVPVGNDYTYNRHELHSSSLVQLFCLLLVQSFPNHTQTHVITYMNGMDCCFIIA